MRHSHVDTSPQAPTPGRSTCSRARRSRRSPTLEGPFDLVFIDADKSSYGDYYEAVLAKLAPRGLIAVDNTLWSGRILDYSDSSEDTVALRRFNEKVASDERVVAALTTVRDGVTLIRRAD